MADQGALIATDASAALIHVPPPAELAASELKGQAPLDAVSLERAASSDGDLELFGQSRALDAIRLAIGIDAAGYNVFVSGLRSRHERESVMRLLSEKAATMPTPGDWVYVNNFRNPESPVAIYLQPGQGAELRARMTQLIGLVLEQLPKAFRREDFDQERAALRDKYNKRAQELFGNLETRARERGFAIQSAPSGQVIFIPLVDGKMPESPEALGKAMAAKTDAEREQLAKVQGELQDELGTLMLRQQEMMRELIDDIRAIERAFAARLITPSLEELKHHFHNPAVDAYLNEVGEHMLGNLDRFREAPAEQGPRPATTIEDGARWSDYQVNVMVDNSATRGAPVVLEDAPTYRNLFGTIERWIDPLGRSGTNFTRIIGGSFLKSHGGFLVFDLEDAVVEPGVWKTLKRSLKSGRMTLETFEPLPFFSMSGLKPEAIEIRNKVVVLGGADLYNLLYFYEPDFADLFKVKAEMRPSVVADGAAAAHYAARVGTLARRENLPPFEAGALAKIVEFGMRMAGDKSRVLAMLEPIDDLARESAYFARNELAQRVTGCARRAGAWRADAAAQFYRGGNPQADRGRHARRSYSRHKRWTDQRAGRAGRRRLQFRAAGARNRDRGAWAGGRDQHRARGADVGIDARQGNHDPERIYPRAVRTAASDRDDGEHLLRAIVLGNRRRQRQFDRAVRAAVGAVGSAA